MHQVQEGRADTHTHTHTHTHTDACIKWKNGELQPILEQAGFRKEGEGGFGGYQGDAFEFLPKWMSQVLCLFVGRGRDVGR